MSAALQAEMLERIAGQGQGFGNAPQHLDPAVRLGRRGLLGRPFEQVPLFAPHRFKRRLALRGELQIDWQGTPVVCRVQWERWH